MKSKGFTLVETLVVLVVLSIVGLLTFYNFRDQKIQQLDTERKNNINTISLVLEAYKDEHGFYPISENGKIKSCNQNNLCFKTEEAQLCSWDRTKEPRQMCDEKYLIYIEQVPTDPNAKTPFCYWSDQNSYKIYAKLEGKRDVECFNHDSIGNCVPVDCNNQSGYTFGIASKDTKLF